LTETTLAAEEPAHGALRHCVFSKKRTRYRFSPVPNKKKCPPNPGINQPRHTKRERRQRCGVERSRDRLRCAVKTSGGQAKSGEGPGVDPNRQLEAWRRISATLGPALGFKPRGFRDLQVPQVDTSPSLPAMAASLSALRPLSSLRSAIAELRPPQILCRRSLTTIYSPKPEQKPLPANLPPQFYSQIPTRYRPDQGTILFYCDPDILAWEAELFPANCIHIG